MDFHTTVTFTGYRVTCQLVFEVSTLSGILTSILPIILHLTTTLSNKVPIYKIITVEIMF